MRLYDDLGRQRGTRLSVALLCVLMFGLGGCRHKTQVASLPPVQAPVELVPIPPPSNPPLVESTPVKLPPPPTAAAAAKPKREKKKSAAPKTLQTAPPPVLTASATAAAETTAIGALTAEGEASPQTKQETEDLIASIEKRLNALPAQTVDEQKVQISKIRNFWRDAQAALKSGDAEGAKTLATKAKLLLDDLEK